MQWTGHRKANGDGCSLRVDECYRADTQGQRRVYRTKSGHTMPAHQALAAQHRSQTSSLDVVPSALCHHVVTHGLGSTPRGGTNAERCVSDQGVTRHGSRPKAEPQVGD